MDIMTTCRSRSARWLLGCALAFSFSTTGGGAARAAAPVLKWKFTPGEALHYQMDQKTVTERVFNGQDLKTTVTQTTEMTWAVKSVDPAGTAEIAQTVDRIRTKIEPSVGKAFEFDSKEAEQPTGLIAAQVVPTLKALAGTTFLYKLSPQGEPSDIKVPESLIKSLKDSSKAAPKGGMFSEEGFKNMIKEMSFVLPGTPLDKPWTRQTKQPSPIGTMVLDKTYKYDGSEANAEKIVLDVKATFEPAPNLNVKLGGHEGKGVFLFDNKAGRVVSATVHDKTEMTGGPPTMPAKEINEISSVMKLVKTDSPPAK
jgi:hypothetical protein